MIQPLRDMHARVFIASAIALPVLFLSALLSRENLPAESHKPTGKTMNAVDTHPQLTFSADRTRINVRVFDSEPRGSAIEFQLIPQTPLHAPDVLVYWSQTKPETNLSSGMQLLGEFRPDERYRLSAAVPGFVVLYSLAHREILGAFPVGTAP